eukprot:gene9474-10463_t
MLTTAKYISSVCYCGRLKEQHNKDKLEHGISDKTWDIKKHIKRATTNAYGEIEFHGGQSTRRTRAQYIRLSDDDSVEDVLKLLLGEWKLKPPKLLISAIGGKRDFSLPKEYEQQLQQGLLKFATTTDAWVITGGTNTGVMKRVGRALQGTPTENNMSPSGAEHKSVPCIGIASWGNVEHRDRLFFKEEEMDQERFETAVCYFTLHRKGRKGAYLDNNHTHFLLVDDGTVGNYDVEKEFRRKLEKEIINRFNVPTVLLVLDGGPKTLKRVKEAINEDPPIPVVVISDGGRVADLLAFAHDLSQEEGKDRNYHSKPLRKMISQTFSNINRKGRREISEDLRHCMKKQEMITFCKITEGSGIEQAIITALFNRKFSTDENNLKLALRWNRADIARSFIFTQNPQWSDSFLRDQMMMALGNDRPDFVDLLLEQGFNLKCFLTRSLDENSLMKCFLGGRKDKLSIPLDEVKKIFTQLSTLDTRKWLDDNNGVQSPFNQLFIWAVLNNMQKMALLFWKTGEESLAKALVACRLYLEMAGYAEQNALKDDIVNIVKSLKANGEEFQDYAIDILCQCFSTDKQKSHNLLKYELTNWGRFTCLKLARYSNHEKFIAHTCCQEVLDGIWTGAMTMRAHESLKTLLCIFCPPMIMTLQFCKTSEIPGFKPLKEKQRDHDESSNEKRELNSKSTDDSSLGCFQKFKEFYSAPITRFWGNVLSYLVFLMLFTYVVLGKLTTKLQNEEIVLILFVVSLTTEEIRQIVQSDSIKHWGQDKWNICDAIAILLFYVGLGFRLNPSTIGPGHVIWSIDIIMWIIRLLEIFSYNMYLGPYVVMIEKMTADLCYFLSIMAVILFAYGVARQALLDPVSPISWKSIVKIFFTPYWQTYGELFLHEDHLYSGTTTVFDTKKYNQYSEPIVSVLMALYMLVANILLLNLLIAIFNNTYAEVQRNSERIWKFQRYDVIVQYTKRPFFVPPFVVINHVKLLCKHIYRKCCRMPRSKDKRMKISLTKKELSDLLHFEEECLAELLTNYYLSLTSDEKATEELKKEIRETAMKISNLEVAEEKAKEELHEEIKQSMEKTAMKISNLETYEKMAKERLIEELKESKEELRETTLKIINLEKAEEKKKEEVIREKQEAKQEMMQEKEMISSVQMAEEKAKQELHEEMRKVAMNISKDLKEKMRETTTKISCLEDKIEIIAANLQSVLQILKQGSNETR